MYYLVIRLQTHLTESHLEMQVILCKPSPSVLTQLKAALIIFPHLFQCLLHNVSPD